MSDNTLFLFTKPARPGLCKTRLIGALTPEQAAEIHAAFRDDVRERLARGGFRLEIAWALDEGEKIPAGPEPARRQVGADLGERLYNALAGAGGPDLAGQNAGAIGSDHPEIALETVEDAFRRLAEDADLVVGPASDGGYYLIAVKCQALDPRLFDGIAWSTADVLSETLRRARSLGLRTDLLAEGHDVDRPDDLLRLARHLRDADPESCPRTRRLLDAWGFFSTETFSSKEQP